MSEHTMFKDVKRRAIICAKCGLPWPCEPKKSQILADIKARAEALKRGHN